MWDKVEGGAGTERETKSPKLIYTNLYLIRMKENE